MTNAELEKLLKKAPVPERTPEYWEQFPQRLAAKIWSAPAERSGDGALAGASAQRPPEQSKPARWLWAAGLATACVLLGFALGFRHGRGYDDPSKPLALARKYFQEIEPMFPHQVQAIVFDQQGPRLVLAETPSVPDSPPLFIHIVGPSGSQNFITFSGQQIHINDDTFEVLLDRRGDVLLVGRQWVWSSAAGASAPNRYRITARPLGSAS